MLRCKSVIWQPDRKPRVQGQPVRQRLMGAGGADDVAATMEIENRLPCDAPRRIKPQHRHRARHSRPRTALALRKEPLGGKIKFTPRAYWVSRAAQARLGDGAEKDVEQG
jgi:hypothetical protein